MKRVCVLIVAVAALQGCRAHQKSIGWGLFGGGVAMIGVGVVHTGVEASNVVTWPNKQVADEMNSQAVGRIVPFYVAGAILAAAGALIAAKAPKDDDTAKIRDMQRQIDALKRPPASQPR